MDDEPSSSQQLLLRSVLDTTAATSELTASSQGVQQQPLELAVGHLQLTRSKLQSSVALRRDEGLIPRSGTLVAFTSDPPEFYLYQDDRYIRLDDVSHPTMITKMKSSFRENLKKATFKDHLHMKNYYEDCYEDESQQDEDEHGEETQKEERKTDPVLAKCQITESEDMKILTSSTFDTDPQCFSVLYPIRLELSEETLPPTTTKTSRFRDECKTGEASEKSDDITSSPVFSKHWQDCFCLSAEGGSLQIQGSDVVLQVPASATVDNTNITVHAAICANDVYIKHKLQPVLPATETIVSPLAEFWAGPDFCFQNHVQITLPTCLPSDYDASLLHVYCITNGRQKEEINISTIQRLDDVTQTSDKGALVAYFYVSEERQVEVMTLHFSGYVCTYCGLCQNIGLEVYASHKHDNESVQVSVIAQLWDRLHISDFRQWKPEDNSYREVLSTTFQLKKMLIPAELQVDLIIDNEKTTSWQFNQILTATKTFCLNWGKVTCVNCKEHRAVKYTDLGPFSPGWMLKCKSNENRVLPSTLAACIRISHLKTQESIEPLWHSAPYQVDFQSRNGKEKCVSNGINAVFLSSALTMSTGM